MAVRLWLQSSSSTEPPMRQLRKALQGLLLFALLALGAAAWYLNLLPLMLSWLMQQPRSLSDYQVDLEARPIDGLPDNVSGLTYNHRSGTLWTVINRPAQVAEISTEGRLLRRLPLRGVRDPEGITHVEEDLYVISDEASNRLHVVRIASGQTEVVVGQQFHSLHLPRWDNLGLEGVSWDEQRRRLWMVNEKWPRRVSHVDGAFGAAGGAVVDWEHSLMVDRLLSDLSSLTTDPATGHLLLLSDETAMLVELSADGRWLGALPLWSGYGGLTRKVPQAEGLAVGPDRAIYIVSEPNLFYRFRRSGS